MTQREVEGAILELIAQELRRDPKELKRELAAKGIQLPVDSPLMVEIILALEDRFGITLPDDAATAACMRSVQALARRVCEVAVRPSKKGKAR